jgi:hypothetical protein
MGRFMSPDWSEEPDPVPYADLENPQTLNLYGYVTNNPLRLYDPTGHSGCCDVLPSMAEVDAGIAYLEGGVETAATVSAGAVVGTIGLIGSQIFAPASLGDPAETRYLRMQAQHGKNRVIPTNYESLTDEQLQEAYDKEKDPVVKEQLKKALKDRELKNSRQKNNKKAAAPKLKMDPASVRARQQANPIPLPAPTPPAPDPPKPPKDDHGDHP